MKINSGVAGDFLLPQRQRKKTDTIDFPSLSFSPSLLSLPWRMATALARHSLPSTAAPTVHARTPPRAARPTARAAVAASLPAPRPSRAAVVAAAMAAGAC